MRLAWENDAADESCDVVTDRAPEGPLACPVCGGETVVRLRGQYDDRYGYPGQWDRRRCRRCGHATLDARFSDEDLGRLYTVWYPRAANRYEDTKPYRSLRGFRAWLDGTRHSAFRSVPPNVSVLDIGCAYGHTLAYHAERGCRAVGIEADQHAVAEGRRQGLDIRQGLFDAGDFEPGSFDYVTLDQVLEHAQDPRAFLAGVATVLKPGGAVVVSTPNVGGYGARLLGRRWIHWHPPYHLNVFNRTSLSRLAHDVGLEVRSIRTVTDSGWLRHQWFHFFTRGRPGESSVYWDPRRKGRPRRRARAGARWLDRLHAFQLVTRLADALGLGDNMLAILVKPGPP